MKVLIAPLDWGLGHATRCVPIVREFLRQGAQVELAVVKSNAFFFRGVFPELRQHLAPSYNIVYPKHGYNMGLWLLKNGIHLKKVIEFEHRFAEEMVERFHYDVIFSDNRFGFFSRKAKSIYMTHQRRIAFPPLLSSFESLGELWHNTMIKQFDELWVPDIEEKPGFAGAMSHAESRPCPTKFVGLLSRFSGLEIECSPSKKYQFVAVVSGVEPARSRLESRLSVIFSKLPGRCAIIQGRPSAGMKSWTKDNVDFFTHLPDEAFSKVIGSAQWVVSRGGYSTVMDMAVLGAQCIFVPTPGQFEQIILARDLQRSNAAICIQERNLTAQSLLLAASNQKVRLPQITQQSLLQQAVAKILNKNSLNLG